MSAISMGMKQSEKTESDDRGGRVGDFTIYYGDKKQSEKTERFKAKLLVELDEKLRGKLPVEAIRKD